MLSQELVVSSAPHLDCFLSLDQTRTFTFIGTPRDDCHSLCGPDARRLIRPTRTSCAYPIRVDTLVAHFHHPGDTALSLASAIYGGILCLFSPTHVALSATHQLANVNPPWVRILEAPWHSLQTLSVSGIIWSHCLSYADFFSQLAAASLSVTVDLTGTPDRPTRTDKSHMLGHLVYELTPGADEEGERQQAMLAPEWPQVKELVVKTRSQKQKEQVVQAVHESWDYQGELIGKERDRREAMIRFVVDD